MSGPPSPVSDPSAFEARATPVRLKELPVMAADSELPMPLRECRPRRPSLTVIVPVFNEEKTIERLLERLLNGPYPDKQVIIVDDGSSDTTPVILRRWATRSGIVTIRHPHNQGKGTAVRTALAHATGEITVIQDADLEYDPWDLPQLIEPLRQGCVDVVFGSRYLSPSGAVPWTKFRVAVSVLNLLVLLLYSRKLTDEATCYKALRTSLLRALNLQATRFELCAELTAKICRLGIAIVEVPISYRARSSSEGKKIGWRDAWQAIWTLVKWRFCAVQIAIPSRHQHLEEGSAKCPDERIT